ncbi:MAG TPA: sugar porter family MFS transporter [Ignavibacteriales bacterium]|nr:sugar porter family MFS transporter [Ignavibacteriales bacterium]
MNLRLFFYTVTAALGGMLFGFDTAVISGTTKFIQPYFALTDAGLGFTVSIALIGTVIGSIVVGRPGDLYGRRAMLLICAVLYLISSIGCAVAGSWAMLLVFRFIGGLGVGAASVMAPMYIAEIAPGHLRGRLVAIAQFNIVAGILIAFFSNYLLVNIGDANWRWMFGVQAFPSILFLILLFFIPESPRWIVKKNLISKARQILQKVGSVNVDTELEDIVNSLKEETGKGNAKLFQKKYSFPISCAIWLAIFNQLSGINVILYYAPMIFEKTGITTDTAMLQAVAVGVTNMVFTLIAMLFIDKFGRKTLLLIGAVGMFISLGGAAIRFYQNDFSGMGILIYIIGFIASFAFSQGAVIWVFLAEIFPNKVRSQGQALGSFVHWIMNALIAWTFPIMLSGMGGGAVFMFFAIMMIPFFIFVWKVMPETKGRTLEDLEKYVLSK